jgi:hypothetical protein
MAIVEYEPGAACTWAANDDPTVCLDGLPLHSLPKP